MDAMTMWYVKDLITALRGQAWKDQLFISVAAEKAGMTSQEMLDALERHMDPAFELQTHEYQKPPKKGSLGYRIIRPRVRATEPPPLSRS